MGPLSMSNSGFVLAWAVALGSCSGRPAKAPQGERIVVEVVDPQGAPLGNAEVEGLVEVNPGIVASTCCVVKHFASARTSNEGRAILEGAPITFRAFYLDASFRDWPQRRISWRLSVGKPNVVRVQLGPAREVQGRVDLGSDCTRPSELEVRASGLPMSARVAADGSFRFSALPPWAVLSVNACGRSASQALDVGNDQPVILALPREEAPHGDGGN